MFHFAGVECLASAKAFDTVNKKDVSLAVLQLISKS